MDPTADALELYHHLIAAWDRRDAKAMAALFIKEGSTVGFDGSVLGSPADIEQTLGAIFAQHPTPPFIAKVRGVRMLTDDTAIVDAIAGMVPPGKTELDPALNAVQSLVAVRRDGKWKVALFQNTPAALHGRPELVKAMTAELREVAGGNAEQSLAEG